MNPSAAPSTAPGEPQGCHGALPGDGPKPAPRSGPLAGVRILDLTAVVLGPLATQMLGDMGADIIKVESPEGDLMRANGVSTVKGLSSIFLAINRNKRSIAIDLKRPEGVAALQRLLPQVDVLVHNMRTAAIDRLGLGYAACAAINPKLVYCVATGFGEGGPDAGKPAFDDVIQAACGLAALIGQISGPGSGPDSGSGGEPNYVPSLIADKTTGMALANAVLAALFERERSGLGQQVEVPMLETMAAFTLAEHLGGLSFEPPTAPAGYARLLAGGRQPAPTLDGHVAMLPYTGEHWRRFFQAVGRADLCDQYDVDDRHARNARIHELYADMAAITRTLSTDALLALCQQLDIPATRVWPVQDLPEHPHLKAVGLFERQHHPVVGPMLAVRPTTRFSRTPSDMALPAPVLGEHGVQILREAGLSDGEIADLRSAGVLRDPPARPPAATPAARTADGG